MNERGQSSINGYSDTIVDDNISILDYVKSSSTDNKNPNEQVFIRNPKCNYVSSNTGIVYHINSEFSGSVSELI